MLAAFFFRFLMFRILDKVNRKVLTLNGATIDYGTSSVNGIRNESVDGLTLMATTRIKSA